MFLTFLVAVFLASSALLGLLLLLPGPGTPPPRSVSPKAVAIVALASALMLAGGLLWGA